MFGFKCANDRVKLVFAIMYSKNKAAYSEFVTRELLKQPITVFLPAVYGSQSLRSI